jgi:hypothetical protein
MAGICNKRLLCFQFQRPGHAPILEAGIDSIPFVAAAAVAKNRRFDDEASQPVDSLATNETEIRDKAALVHVERRRGEERRYSWGKSYGCLCLVRLVIVCSINFDLRWIGNSF